MESEVIHKEPEVVALSQVDLLAQSMVHSVPSGEGGWQLQCFCEGVDCCGGTHCFHSPQHKIAVDCGPTGSSRVVL